MKGDAGPKVTRVDVEAYSADNKQLFHAYTEVWSARRPIHVYIFRANRLACSHAVIAIP